MKPFAGALAIITAGTIAAGCSSPVARRSGQFRAANPGQLRVANAPQDGVAGVGQISLRIHWLNAETGRPLPNFEFGISFDYKLLHRMDGSPMLTPQQSILAAMTDAEGLAVIEIRSPGPVIRIASNDQRIPGRQYANIVKYAGCSQVVFCTRDLAAAGAAGENVCWPSDKPAPPPPKAQPGEVYLYAKPLGRFATAIGSTGMGRKAGRRLEQIDEAAWEKCPIR